MNSCVPFLGKWSDTHLHTIRQSTGLPNWKIYNMINGFFVCKRFIVSQMIHCGYPKMARLICSCVQWQLDPIWTVSYSFSRKWHVILEPARSFSDAIFLLPHTWHSTYSQVKTNRSTEPCFCVVPRNVLCSGEVIWMAIETEIANKLPKARNTLWRAVSLRCRELVVSHL